ncbi:MAG: hypothetical protein LBP78_07950 [Acidaminococcales bacterium]|jgi:hypothetical protein|nr:hypothetical protein [Acidaminococcales bacterium]
MRKLKILSGLLFPFIFFFASTALAAMEFDQVKFVTGTLLGEKGPKYIPFAEGSDFRLYIPSEGKIQLIDKRSGKITVLNQPAHPLLLYQITTKDEKWVFYAVFDRAVNHGMKTENFHLFGVLGETGYLHEFANLDLLRENGWTAEGLQLRIEKKQLIIDGITRSKDSPDNKMQPFRLDWDEKSQKFTFINQKALDDAQDLPKRLKEDDFVLDGMRLGDNIGKAVDKYGAQFKTSENTDENNQKTFVENLYPKKISFQYDKADNSIWSVAVLTKNIPSPRGVTVGMSLQDVTEKYGRAFKRKRDENHIHYIYAMKKQYPASADNSAIGFAVNNKDKVAMIYIEQWSKALE